MTPVLDVTLAAARRGSTRYASANSMRIALGIAALLATGALAQGGSDTSRPVQSGPPAATSPALAPLLNTFLPALFPKPPPHGLKRPAGASPAPPPALPAILAPVLEELQPSPSPTEEASPAAPPPSLDQLFDEANALLDEGRFEEAARAYEELAAQKHPGAQTNLANLYLLGRGVPRDTGRAVRWYHSAAELGSPRAQFNLARMYELGEGVKRSPGEAARLYHEASRRGYTRADPPLARLILDGAIELDDDEQARVLQSAAVQGDARARRWVETRPVSRRR